MFFEHGPHVRPDTLFITSNNSSITRHDSDGAQSTLSVGQTLAFGQDDGRLLTASYTVDAPTDSSPANLKWRDEVHQRLKDHSADSWATTSIPSALTFAVDRYNRLGRTHDKLAEDLLMQTYLEAIIPDPTRVEVGHYSPGETRRAYLGDPGMAVGGLVITPCLTGTRDNFHDFMWVAKGEGDHTAVLSDIRQWAASRSVAHEAGNTFPSHGQDMHGTAFRRQLAKSLKEESDHLHASFKDRAG